jgi:uncharacterized heparinase superfamily protein
MPANPLLYFHTLRSLKPVQISNRITRRLWRPPLRARAAPPLREPRAQWTPGAPRPASLVAPDTLRLLNVDTRLVSASDWNSTGAPKLLLYQLHYFDDLGTADAAARATWQHALMRRWIAENPPGAGIGWDAYPLSLRVRNWIKWHHAVRALDAPCVESLAQQARWLQPRLEYHLLGNHLLENLVTLAAAGLFFEGPEAEGWLARGRDGLLEQLDEQLLDDGAHIERSAMYQALVLESLLDLCNLHGVYAVEPPGSLRFACTRMLTWLERVTLPDGDFSQLNDSALGFAATTAGLVAYAHRLGLARNSTDAAPSPELMAASGIARCERGPAVLLADVGPLGEPHLAGHGHADTLTFELSLEGQRMIVDTGVSTYEVSARREYERSTAAHNTVCVDGRNSSEVWSSFRVGRQARVHDVRASAHAGVDVVSAWHDGYRRIAGGPSHFREWRLDEKSLHIEDRLQSRRGHVAELSFHFHPELSLREAGKGRIAIMRGERRVAECLCDEALEVSLESYDHHPGFGVSLPARRIRASRQFDRAAILHTLFTF